MAYLVSLICPFLLPATEGYGEGPLFLRLFDHTNPIYIAKALRGHYSFKYGRFRHPGQSQANTSVVFTGACLCLLCGLWIHKEGSIHAGMELLWILQEADITNGQFLCVESKYAGTIESVVVGWRGKGGRKSKSKAFCVVTATTGSAG